MAANGILDFQGTNQVNFMGAASNIVIDTVTASLGIGVDVNGPTSNLHVVGNAHVSTNLTIGGNIDFIGNLTQNGAAYGGGGAADPSPWLPTTVNVPADGIYYTAGNVAVDTNTFFVDTVNDRVGVGTTTPGSTLDVNGSLRAAYDQDVTSYIGKSALGGITYGATFAHKDMNTQFRYALRQTSAGQTMINTKGDQSISFRVGDTEKAKITSGGDFLVDTNTLYVDASENRVGIGTSSPMTALHVSSGTAGDCRLVLEADTDNNNEGDNPRIEFWQDGAIQESAIGMTSNRLNLWNSVGSGGISFHTGTVDGWTNAIERMTITSTGDVGIGVTAPDRLFHVNGISRFVGEVEWFETGQSTSHANYGANRDWYIRSGAADGKVVIQDIHATSNVGIGTSTPGYKLDVTGDIRFTGDIYKGNVLQALNSPFLTNGVAPNRKAYYTDGPVGIANVSALTTQTLQIGANVVVNDTASDKLVVSGSMYLSKNLKVVDEIFAYKITAAEFEQKDVVIVANQPPTAIIMN